jgi:hypothetical protein
MGLNEGYKGLPDRWGDKKNPGSDRRRNQRDVAKLRLIESDIHTLQKRGCHEINEQDRALAEMLALRHPGEVMGAYRRRVETVGEEGIEVLRLSAEKDYLAFLCLSLPPDQSTYAPENLNANPLVLTTGLNRYQIRPESIVHIHQVAQQQGIENLMVSIVRHPLQTASGLVFEPLYCMTSFVHEGVHVGGPVCHSPLFRLLGKVSDKERAAFYNYYVEALLRAETTNQMLALCIPTADQAKSQTHQERAAKSQTHRAFTNPKLSGLPDGKNYIDFAIPGPNTLYFFAQGDQQKNVEYVHILMQDNLFLQRCIAIRRAWTEGYSRAPEGDPARNLGKDHEQTIIRSVEHFKHKNYESL